MQPITLCVIARDEEENLPECLASARSAVDAMVVVDTGSSDRTAALAEKAGAKVVHHAWRDDFAAARNEALAHVEKGFVLILDADERLAEGAGEILRAAVAADDFDAGLLPLHNASSLDADPSEVLAGRASLGEPILLGRLLRRTEDLRFEGIVHEQVSSWLAKGRRLKQISASIVHYGAIPDVRARLKKSQRNLRLLELRARQEPDSPAVLCYLCRELIRAGDRTRALAVASDAWRCIERIFRQPGGSTSVRPDVVTPATLRAYLLLELGRVREAEDALDRAEPWAEAHPNLALLRGLCFERAWLASSMSTSSELLAQARAAYECALAMQGKLFAAEAMPGASSWAASTRLGTVLLWMGRAKDALAAFDLALKLAPAHEEAHLGRVEALHDLGAHAQAICEAEPLLEGRTPDAWILAAAAGLAVESFESVAPLVQRALELCAGNAPLAPHRKLLLDELVALGEELAADGNPARMQVSADDAAVIIPVFNRTDLFRPVLEAFLRERASSGCELIAVDDGSVPDVADLVRSLGAEREVRLLRHDKNRGRGNALNSGLDAARAAIVIFCDADIVPAPGFVRDHLAFHRAEPSVLATHLGALEWGIEPGLFGELMGARSNPRLIGHVGAVDWTRWFTDNWSAKRKLFDQARARFDPFFHTWGWEELELASRLAAYGATSTLTASALGLHLKPVTWQALSASFRRSVPNLLHLSRCVASRSGESAVRVWLSSRFQSQPRLGDCESLLARIWSHLEDLNAQTPGGLCSTQDAFTSALATSFSDVLFRLSIARGFCDLSQGELADLKLPPCDDREKILALASLIGHLRCAEERFAVRPDIASIDRMADESLHLDPATWRAFSDCADYVHSVDLPLIGAR